MPILVLLFAFVAFVYGAVVSFHALAQRFGMHVAVAVAVVVAAVLVALAARWWQRRRDVAPNLRGDGDWTHGVSGEWGAVRLAAGKRLCELTLGGAHGAYIFADLRGAQPAREAGRWCVALDVVDTKRPVWNVPMASEREAKRWTRIFTLAMAQRL
ncbi:hypothetical protein [Paraburkholderia acidipaludis]|uniref:hypothetical protein n=1 Tax=Paraburkholderia acidipaludis TaxID=660537 RepID=UPI0004896506|nr:hypothetical protein [Paraburkholderia acidipaludis]